MSGKIKMVTGSGNVFRDIGSAHSERLLVRAKTMRRIAQIIRERGMTQIRAARTLNIPQSKVSCLMNGKLSMFSLEHLFELLNVLDRDVKIIIQPKAPQVRTAKTRIISAL